MFDDFQSLTLFEVYSKLYFLTVLLALPHYDEQIENNVHLREAREII